MKNACVEKDADGNYLLHIRSGELSAMFDLSAMAGELRPVDQENVIQRILDAWVRRAGQYQWKESLRSHEDNRTEKLREVRSRLEMTQQQVADAIGTDANSISRFERGIRDPSLLELLAYSRMGGVGMEVLIDDKLRLAQKRKDE